MKNELFLGSPIATATVNVPEIKIDNNQIIINGKQIACDDKIEFRCKAYKELK